MKKIQRDFEFDMSEDISARNVTKFNGQNFQCWKFQVRALFTVYGVQDVVSGERTLPAEVAGEAAEQAALRLAWRKDNAQAMYRPCWSQSNSNR